ncbi:MAG TPA: S41 family peptidase [Gemmatimonadaceae bacterium]
MAIRSRATIVTLVLCTALASGGWLMERGLRGTGSPGSGAQLFNKVMTLVEQSYVDSVPEGQLYNKAVEGLLDELNDPHSVLLGPDRLRSLTESTSGHYAGVGIQMDLRDGWITVVAPVEGGPAERAGIRTGDRIVEVEGKSTSGWTADEASKALRGPPGSPIRLMVERPGVAEHIPIQLKREEIRVSPVSHTRMLGGDVGYVEMTIFSEASARDLRAAIEKLRGQGMRKLVFDLRGNPGGLLDQGVQVAELFLDPGQRVVSTRGRTEDATLEFTDDTPQEWRDMPVVVLVDHGSASASEIVAGALQDQDRAAIVGAQSYGKGSAQSLFPLGADGALKLTTAKWFTPLGRSIDRPAKAADDEQDDDTRAPSAPVRVKTPSGRTVMGGGGITPDVTVEDTVRPPAERAFEQALGKNVAAFRDVLATYALELKGAGTITSPDFVVTPAMREALYRRLTARKIVIDSTTWANAEPLVTRILGAQIARYALGPDAEFARGLRSDKALAASLQLLNGVRSQRELLDRAATMAAAAKADSASRK